MINTYPEINANLAVNTQGMRPLQNFFGKKFMYKAFKRLIASTSNLPIKEEGENLEKVLENWMKGFDNQYNQMDDIIIIGIKI